MHRRQTREKELHVCDGQSQTKHARGWYAILHIGDAVTIDEVIFGEPGALEILGARTLEGMNLRVDPRAKKLVAGGPILAE